MPSYRVILTVGLLRPGVRPEQVLPAAVAAAAELATVEFKDVAVVAGEARITVRYQADDDDRAEDIAGRVTGEVTGLAQVPKATVTRRGGTAGTRSGPARCADQLVLSRSSAPTLPVLACVGARRPFRSRWSGAGATVPS